MLSQYAFNTLMPPDEQLHTWYHNSTPLLDLSCPLLGRQPAVAMFQNQLLTVRAHAHIHTHTRTHTPIHTSDDHPLTCMQLCGW